jgi:predicted lactoylglutathione lyase
MIDHAGVQVKDFSKGKEFYKKALAPLGYTMGAEFPEWNVAGFGVSGKNDFWIHTGEVKETSHIAFAASNKAAVDSFHSASLEAGGKDNGAPGYRKDYAPGYYAAFAYDPDGNNIEAVYHDLSPTP